MNSYFAQLDLEMIALESAIGAFEVENNITDEYLSDYSSDDYVATESAHSDDFGFGLFDDMSPATESADDKPAGNTSGGIKNIMAAVGRFFTKVKDGIVNFFKSFKSKKAQVKDPKVSPAAEKVAGNLRGAIKSAINIIGNVTKEDTAFMKKLCTDISAAITAAGVDDTTLNLKSGKRDEAMAKVSSKFIEGMGGEDHTDEADERIQKGEEILEKVKKTKDDLNNALNRVSDIFKAEVKKVKLAEEIYDERDNKRRGETTYQNDMRKESHKTSDQNALNAFNDEANKRTGVGAAAATDAKGITKQALINQIKQAIFSDIQVSDIQTLCSEVVTACATNADFCTKVANKELKGGSAAAKRAYKLCRILSKASTVYTNISSAITELTTGTIFTVGEGNATEKYGSIDVRRNTGKKDEQDFINE